MKKWTWDDTERLIAVIAAAAAAIFLVVLLVFFVGAVGANGQAWAAWTQALGSLGALGIAVYVLRKQNENLLAAERGRIADKERRALLALKTEIEVRWGQFMERIGSRIESRELRSLGAFEWRRPENPFHVYYAMCNDLGLIRDDDTRKALIETYAEMEGLLLSIDTWRAIVADAASFRQKNPTTNGWETAELTVKSAINMLEEHHQTCKEIVEKCLRLIGSQVGAGGDL